MRCAGVFQDSAKQNSILLPKTPSSKTFLCITVTEVEVSFQASAFSTAQELLSSVPELYKKPWGVALMFPSLCFLGVADITGWKRTVRL